ncbi:uncharacterized protein LOC132807134 isoform X2 [Hemiscyllium ocellatum]|uniref:uncharacterized protein LOC132807134 isoform X2 n=1 Tax=Hemiscyllium ocellatum TaxID=170820 RepID=UPI002966AF90|nr:uncharacterized protein LOC132807134 isoform X2 [Hemiscyllium ocellatum]
MAEQPLAKMVEIAVREFTSEADLQSPQTLEDEDSNPMGKRRRVEVEPGDMEEDNIQTLLYAASKTLCLRLDAIEAHLNSMEDKCKCLRAKVDLLAGQNSGRSGPGERAPGDRHRPGLASSTSPPPPQRVVHGSGILTEEDPIPQEMGVPVRASRDLDLGVGGSGEGQPGALQGLGPGVHIVALCADARSEGEERTDATNLLYQLMY